MNKILSAVLLISGSYILFLLYSMTDQIKYIPDGLGLGALIFILALVTKLNQPSNKPVMEIDYEEFDAQTNRLIEGMKQQFDDSQAKKDINEIIKLRWRIHGSRDLLGRLLTCHTYSNISAEDDLNNGIESNPVVVNKALLNKRNEFWKLEENVDNYLADLGQKY
jgi:hypothetical protein